MAEGEESTATLGAGVFDQVFSRLAGSGTLRAVFQQVYGDDYPLEAGPLSFVTRRELAQLAAALALRPGQQAVDIACGQGGLSLWLAQTSGAAITGVDFSGAAVQAANARAQRLGLADQARFVQADAADTGLPAAHFDGALSTDALQLMPDPQAVIREIGRILKPGARFAFTTWRMLAPLTGRAFVPDYRPLLTAAGFEVEQMSEPPGWRAQQAAVYALLRQSADALRQELGQAVADLLLAEAEQRPHDLERLQRVLGVARKVEAHHGGPI